jgi:prepilin-type N-terminal cleavage/methylation domain-containing protein
MKRLKSTSAFTIVELLVVIVVIGILAAITIVSYSGITSRANIATIQSDLTNASNVLKMDQTVDSNNNFPTTLVGANSGKDITPSQAMDSVIYVPDNTSNPKNFCLQYRKGSITYAVDNNTAPSKGVCLQNLVSNGDFSQGVSGWTSTTVTGYSIMGGVATFTATAQYGRVGTTATVAVNVGDKIYYSAMINAPYGAAVLGVGIGTGGGNVQQFSPPAVFNSYATISAIWAATSTSASFAVYDTKSSASWSAISVNHLEAINLTTIFGAGNEPTTAAQMDAIMNNYPNNWFNIVVKASL